MSRDKTYYFIVNGNAGGGRGKYIWKNLLKRELIARGVHYRAYECAYPGHAAVLAEKICTGNSGALTLAVVGGDGTFNEVLNGITDFERVTVGFIPVGSANDLGYALGFSGDYLRALRRVLGSGKICRMDIGKTTFHRDGSSRYFAISSGVGMDAAVCKSSRSGKLKSMLNQMHLGMLIYLVNAVRIVFSQELNVGKLIFSDGKGNTKERKVHRLYFLAGMNQPYEGGHLAMAPHAKANDGKLSFAMAHDLSRVQALFSLALLAFNKHEHIPGYEVVSARKCHIMLKDNWEVHTDGETFGGHWDITVECLPRKLQMILL